MYDIQVKPGEETTEHKFTRYLMIAASVLATVGVVLESLASAGIGGKFVGVAMAIVGALTGLIAKIVYETKRTELKSHAMTLAAQVANEEMKTVRSLDDAVKTFDAAVKKNE